MDITFTVVEVKRKFEDGYSRVKLSAETLINQELGLVSSMHVWSKTKKRPKKGTTITLRNPVIETIPMLDDNRNPRVDEDGHQMMVRVLRSAE